MPAMPMTERFCEAVTYAAEAHAGQSRKGTDVPYLSHPLGVAALVLEDGGSETEAIAALLHDLVEDQGGVDRLSEVRARFGDDVAAIVESCTDHDVTGERDEDWQPRKRRTIDHIADMTEPARRVALADKVHNARAILRDYRIHGEMLWERFNAGRDDQLWYLRALTAAFALDSSSPMVADLEAAVRELDERVEANDAR